MADKRLSELTELAAAPATDDEVYIRDVSEAAADESKRITIANLLANLLAAVPTIVHKTADETVNNSNTLQNDDHLIFAVGANEIWELKLIINIVYVSITPGFKFGFAYPSGADIRFAPSNMTALYAAGYQNGNEVTMNANMIQGTVLISVVIVNSSTGGNLTFKWSQGVATAENTVVKKGSCIIAHQIV